MNWEAIGAIGEILGAITVVLTLLYLAVQVKYAREATIDANRLNRANGIQSMLLALCTNEDLRSSVIQAQGSSAYYDDLAKKLGISRQQAEILDQSAAYWFWLHWSQFASSTSDADIEELTHLIRNFYSQPQMRSSWEGSTNAKPILEPHFVKFVDQILADETHLT